MAQESRPGTIARGIQQGELLARGRPESAAQHRSEHLRRRDLLYRRALAFGDSLLALVALLVAVHGTGNAIGWPVVFVPLLVVATMKVVGLYDHDATAMRQSTIDEIPSLFTTTALLASACWLAGGVLTEQTLGRTDVLALWGVALLGMATARAVVRSAVRRSWPTERCLLIGSRESWDRLALSMQLRTGLELVDYFAMRTRARGRFEPLGTALATAKPRLGEVIERDAINRVIISMNGIDEMDENLLDGIFALEQLGVKVSVVPHMLEVIGSAGKLEDFDGLPVLGIRAFGLTRSSRIIKRAFDLVVASLLLALAWPVLAVAAIAVRRSTPGPVLYRQRRVGLRGEEFKMLKFRTMVDGADALQETLAAQNETAGLFKIGADPRITATGRWLRPTSLDELPQLFNVLRGEMSLVGPRPLVACEDEAITGWRRRRLELCPGMTGPWQVLGATRVPLEEMVKMDYLYIANWSPWADVKALMYTLPHMLGRRGL